MDLKPGDKGNLELPADPLHGCAFEFVKQTSAGLAIIRLTEKSTARRRGFNVGDVLHVPLKAFVPNALASAPEPAEPETADARARSKK